MHLFCLLVLPLMPNHFCEVVHTGKRVGMLFARHLLRQLECLPMHLLCILVLPLMPKHFCEVIHAAKCVWAPWIYSLENFESFSS